MENVNIILARCKPSKCGSAGIGRQARLRILCQQWRVGSSPIFRSKTSSENLRSFCVRYYKKNALSFIIGKKKKQKWQYNENALRICKKRTANLENVKKCFQGKKSSPYLCVNSLRYILHLIRLLMIVAAVELSEPVYHAMLPTL